MKRIFLFFICSLFVMNAFGQTVIRVVAGDNLQTKMDNATSGSILLVEAGFFGDINFTKPLTLIGTGYMLGNAGSTQTNNMTATINKVNLLPTANGSALIGFKISSDIYNGASNCVLKRNYLQNIIYLGGSPINVMLSFLGYNDK